MKIKYLGTAAAEGIPAIFCECDTCKKARALGGREIRTRSQALIDDKILIDFPSDTYCHSLTHGIELAKIKTCLITHSHMDHLYPAEIEMRKQNLAVLSEPNPLTFYSDRSGYDKLTETAKTEGVGTDRVNIVLINPLVPFETQGYKVLPIRASHDYKSDPLVYIIEKDGKSLFYSNDTSDYSFDSWNALENYGKKLDLVSLDCTEGTKHISYVGHMSLERVIEVKNKLINKGLADEKTVFVLNHFSHNGGDTLYSVFSKIAAEYGFCVSYDGLTVDF